MSTPLAAIPEQLAQLERFVGRALPGALRSLYLSGQARALGLLPVATGRECSPARSGGPSTAESFLDAHERFHSVLGCAMGNAELAQSSNDVWPQRLLAIEDVGCAILRAVDLDDANLRVVEYESLEPVEDPDAAAGGATIAFREPVVPRELQHRFTVVAESLGDWVRSKARGE